MTTVPTITNQAVRAGSMTVHAARTETLTLCGIRWRDEVLGSFEDWGPSYRCESCEDVTSQPETDLLPHLDIEGTEEHGIFIPDEAAVARIVHEDQVDTPRHITRDRRLCR